MDEQKQLMISDLRKLLETAEAEHGDLPCTMIEADTSLAWIIWIMKPRHVTVDRGRLCLVGSYGDEIEMDEA